MSFSTAVPNLKIWDNAAFDADDHAGAKPLLPLQPISMNVSKSPDLDQSKKKPSKQPCKQNFGEIRNHDNVDAEIEELEKEIRRLSLKLEALLIKKAEREFKIATARRGRIVPAKFMEQKPSPASKKIEESPARFSRRGLSLGPSEIYGSVGKSCFQKLEGIREENSPIPLLTTATEIHGCKKDASSSGYRRRGQSLGPSEIGLNSRSRLPNKLQQIKEKKKRQSLSMSPRSRKPSISTISELRKGIATVSAIKAIKREDSILRSFNSKKLFQEEQNQISSKKPSKNARVRIVASRYSLAEPESKRRKWSILEPQKRSFSLGESSKVSESPKKGEENGKPLLIPSSPPSIMKIATMLPRIRTLRNKDLSPRDSGCAKRASQLADNKSHFSMEDDQVGVVSPCKFPEL
ncbi:uncharacterized protein LOC110036106 [Phalaenopsis equestris]|uniref:uncharacterized protein LOC110036106 n=1 Tax=Phalaenopsis equestris TaxID=78828 RepID=UPI0009E32956|nr:uncharacterized protein LOC110036106 [Phalaenopsis equestris]